MELKLTRRQRQFLFQFISYFNMTGNPVHYAHFAEHLDLRNTSVYEMLRLLEDRGLVNSDYHFRNGSIQRGPGRPVIVFKPNQAAYAILSPVTNSGETRAWRNLKTSIYLGLRELNKTGYESCISPLLSRISKRRSPLLFTAEMITIFLVTFISFSDSKYVKLFLDRLTTLPNISDLNLTSFKLELNSLADIRSTNQSLFNYLLTQSQKFERSISKLKFDHRVLLTEFVRDAARILTNV